MTKKHFTLHLAVISFFTLLLSCEQPAVVSQKVNDNMRSRPKQLIETTQHGLEIENIHYNPDETVAGLQNRNGQKLHIDYQPGQVTYTFSEGKKINVIVKYKLLKSGPSERVETHYGTGGNKDNELVTTYAYNAGKLVSETYVEDTQPDGHTEFLYDQDGNLESSKRYDAQQTLVRRKTFTYTKHPDLSGFISQFDARMDAHLFPEKSTKLLATQTDEANGKVVKRQYLYKLDSAGYIEKGEIKTIAPHTADEVSGWENIWD